MGTGRGGFRGSPGPCSGAGAQVVVNCGSVCEDFVAQGWGKPRWVGTRSCSATHRGEKNTLRGVPNGNRALGGVLGARWVSVMQVPGATRMAAGLGHGGWMNPS